MDKYEEALEKARVEYEKARKQGYTWLMGLLEGMFPDLEESEDEKIRKWIIDELKDSLHEIETMYSGDYDNRDEQDKERQEYLNKALAWLEKQKPIELEQLAKLREMTHEIRDAYERGIEVGRVESQQEWSEEDEIRRESCMLYLANTRDLVEFSQYIGDNAKESGKQEIQKDIDWLKSLPERFNLQPKQEWTIEDAKPGDILHTSSTASSKTFIFKGIRNDEHGSVECFCCSDSEDGFRKGEEELIGWKTDKYRLATPKQCIKLGRIMGKAGYIFHFETNQLQKLNKLHWKPSKEQMNALYDILHPADPVNLDTIKSLYNDLKRL